MTMTKPKPDTSGYRRVELPRAEPDEVGVSIRTGRHGITTFINIGRIGEAAQGVIDYYYNGPDDYHYRGKGRVD